MRDGALGSLLSSPILGSLLIPAGGVGAMGVLEMIFGAK
jgi:hypothetical protein